MTIKKTIASGLLLFALCLITACSGSDGPPETTTATDNPPIVANAGPDQSVFIGTFVTLNGSKSSNANQTGLTYAWTLTKPASSTATLSDPILVNPTLTVDVEGTYEATLIVTDAQNSSRKSAPATVTVIASKTNPPPVAKIQTASVGVFTRLPVLLDGGQSSDANKDPLKFQWTLAGRPSGSSASLRDATTVAPAFTPDIQGDYRVNLTVNDGTNNSTPASVTIHASDKPSPTAVAGTKLKLFFPLSTSSVTLDGRASHTNPAGGELEYKWIMNSPANYPITDDTNPLARFSPTQNVATMYVAQLTVTEKTHPGPLLNTDSETVSITVGPLALVKAFLPTNLTNPVLTCNVSTCGMATVPPGTAVKLDATESTGEGLTYKWNVTPSTGFTPSTLSGATPVFTPNTAATGGTAYQINLTVKDAGGNTDIRSFTITAKPGPTVVIKVEPPTPRWPQSVKVSLDPPTSDTNLGFKWTFDSQPGSPPHFSEDTLQSTTFTTDKPGEYVVRLTVTDNSTTPPAQNFNTQPIHANNAPVAAISGLSSVDVCSTATFTSASTDDGTNLTHTWGLTSNPTESSGSLSAINGQTFSFKALKVGTHKVSLSVTDNVDSGTTEKTIAAQPNPAGKTIYDSAGLDGMDIRTFGGATGPSCQACHSAGNYDRTSPSTKDLSIVTASAIIARLTLGSGHSGGTTSSDNLNSQVADLKKFLDSTRSSCP